MKFLIYPPYDDVIIEANKKCTGNNGETLQMQKDHPAFVVHSTIIFE